MQFRYARHTADLNTLEDFYTNILGFSVLGRFENHAGYDGVFLAKEGTDWHLELTQSDDVPEHNSDEDDLLVFYPESQHECETILAAIHEAGLELVLPKNPYWIEYGICVLDPDGFRVIISRQRVKG